MTEMDETLKKALPVQYLLLYENLARTLREHPELAGDLALSLFADLLVVKALYQETQERCNILEWQKNRLLILHKEVQE